MDDDKDFVDMMTTKTTSVTSMRMMMVWGMMIIWIMAV